MPILKEFQEFAVKGNALDMAVGIIIGVAFNGVVSSLVNDIIMPPVGLLLGGVEFSDLQIVLKEGMLSPEGVMIGEVAIRYGAFVNAIIEFLIIGFSAFIAVKAMNRIIRRREKTE
ncbi:MAG: large conductance mechanosensitive channel protein MscL [Rhodothermales bacterium]